MKIWMPLLSLFLLACAQDPRGSEVNLKTPSNVIYGEDTREDVADSSAFFKEGAATAVLVEARKLSLNLETANWALTLSPLGKSYPLCPDEKFFKQPVLGFCSGVLITPNKVLTAGHCLRSKDSCQTTKFLFGWNLNKAQSNKIHDSQVYKCKSVLEEKNDRTKGMDYAIVELDRDVTGVTPVKVARNSAPLQAGEKVLSLSYPLGIPLKKDMGVVLEDASDKSFLKVEVDTFMGSSGSPLFNSRGELVGILSSGMEDFLEDDIYRVRTEGGCINFNRCRVGTCFGERFFKASQIDL